MLLDYIFWPYLLWCSFAVGSYFSIFFMCKITFYNKVNIHSKWIIRKACNLILFICTLLFVWSMNNILTPFLDTTWSSWLKDDSFFLSVHVVGYQGGWRYYYGDTLYPYYRSFWTFWFYHYRPSELKPMKFLLLHENDGILRVPFGTLVRITTWSADTIHTWSVPDLGIDLNCIPGQSPIILKAFWWEGVYFGQFPELCGQNHYNAPITIHVMDPADFFSWWIQEFKVPLKRQY